jgi:outer membrane protein assembly factor BamB
MLSLVNVVCRVLAAFRGSVVPWRFLKTNFGLQPGIPGLLLCSLLFASFACAGEWPTFRGDAQRSGVTSDPLTLPLVQTWTYQPTLPPTPAWPDPALTNYAIMYGPLQQTLSFDRAFHVVADSDSIYFGSSSDDSVCCLEASSGALRWRFVTEGPVRLAPVLSKGRLFVGSDDGHVYSLDARSGKLRWKYLAGENEKRLPGNGRMISRWPVRAGLVVDAGMIYFTAGLFPMHGVYLCALDAETGKQVFKQPLDFTAQGTMLAYADRLFVATGRTAFWSCDRKDGKPGIRYGSSDAWHTNLVGGSFALLADGVLATGPSEDGQFHWFDSDKKTPLFRTQGDAAIIHGDTVYLLGKGRLMAMNRAAHLNHKKSQSEPAPLWSVAAGKTATMIIAGDKLVAAGQGVLNIYEAKSGKTLWNAKIDGRVEGLAFCNGRLLVSLDNGRTACFQSGPAVSDSRRSGDLRYHVVAEPTTNQPYPNNPQLAQAAEAAIKNAGFTKGYCLVLQAGTGQLAYEIARRSEFHVICHETDPIKVDAMRVKFLKAGLYGSRIEVHQGVAKELPFPKYFANLIVSETVLTEGTTLPSASEVFRVLRPCGGTVDMMVQAGTAAQLQLSEWGGGLPEWQVTTGKLMHGVARRGRLPGSGEWSHFYADLGNTACSGDEIRPVAMDLQWFGRPGPANMVDRHKKAPAPLYVNGRLFVSGFNYFAALDAYNGFVLWEKHIPRSARIAAFKDSSNIAATESHVMVAAGDSCLVLDAQTGETMLTIPAVGTQPQKAWGYLATTENLIIGTVAKPEGSLRSMGKLEDVIVWKNEQPVVCSSSIFAVDRTTGKRVWEYPARIGAIINPTIAIGNGRVYFVQSKNGLTLESKDGRIPLPELLGQGSQVVALNLKTGVPVWLQSADLSAIQHIIYLSYAKETLLITGSRYTTVDPSETHGRSKPQQLKRVRYELQAFDAQKGAPKWKATATPNYDDVLTGSHGEQVQHPAIVNDIIYGPAFAYYLQTGKPYQGWKWEKSHKCATLSTSLYCAFSRFTQAKVPYIFDLKTGQSAPLSHTRPGCWINTIPAGGLILIPEASAGCTCEYPIQTSLALIPAE